MDKFDIYINQIKIYDKNKADEFIIDNEIDILEKEETTPKKPNMYCVVMLNDDYTPMDFVIWIIQKVFIYSFSEATRLMLEVHNNGSSRIGVFTHDIARTKMERVHKIAAENQHPLQCKLEVLEQN